MAITAFIVFMACTACVSHAWTANTPRGVTPKSISSASITRPSAALAPLSKLAFAAAIIAKPLKATAVQGSVKAATLAESKVAAKQIQDCLEGISKMEKLASGGEYQKVADVYSTPTFSTLETAAGVLVRSEALSPDDKVTLGTIKRYGVVADALIMLGGLGSELRAGGIQVAGGGGLQEAITEDSSDDDDENTSSDAPTVNGGEVKRYLKLSKDALGDIYKIVKPILAKEG